MEGRETTEREHYEIPTVSRIRLDDPQTIVMAVPCKFETGDLNCYQDNITPIFDTSNPS